MPIEIREIIIRATIETQSSKREAVHAPADQEEDHDLSEYLTNTIKAMELKNER